jgi:hypothetical protein
VFHKLRSKFGVNVRLFVAKNINDNINEKTCFYSTIGKSSDSSLNMIVAGYTPDEFEKEFREFSGGVSYSRLQDEPWRNPVLASNKHFARRRDISVNMDDGEISKCIRWATKRRFHRVTDTPMAAQLRAVRPARRALNSSDES